MCSSEKKALYEILGCFSLNNPRVCQLSPLVLTPYLSISWLAPGEALGCLNFQGDHFQPLIPAI